MCTRLRADANFKPSNSLPADVLLGPGPQCRSDNVFKDELTGAKPVESESANNQHQAA